MVKTKYDAVTEMKFAEARWKSRGNRHGMPVQRNKCFICGARVTTGIEVCNECEREFPRKESKRVGVVKPTNGGQQEMPYKKKK